MGNFPGGFSNENPLRERSWQIDRKTVNRLLREQRLVVTEFDPQAPIGAGDSA